MDPDELKDALNQTVEEGMLAISIAPSVTFADGSTEGDLRIENPPGNRFDVRVTIALDDGRVVYATDAVEPGWCIERDRLDVELSAGTYSATATFTAYDEHDAEMGSAAARMTLVVQD